METTVFHNANVLDCTGKDPYVGTVVVTGDRIQAVDPADQVSSPRDAKSFDLEGMALMPGSSTPTPTLGMVVADETVSGEDQLPGATYAQYVAQRIEEFLCGFTTVRDAGMTGWDALPCGLCRGRWNPQIIPNAIVPLKSMQNRTPLYRASSMLWLLDTVLLPYPQDATDLRLRQAHRHSLAPITHPCSRQ